MARPRTGDWWCDTCNEWKFKSKTQCRCGKQQQTCSKRYEPAAIEHRNGDWKCAFCRSHQYAFRKFCRCCGHAKFGDVNEEPKHGPIKLCIGCQSLVPNCVFLHEQSCHMIMCFTCAFRWNKDHSWCPMCRQPIEKIIKLFVM